SDLRYVRDITQAGFGGAAARTARIRTGLRFKKLVPQTGFEPVTPSLRMTYTLFSLALIDLSYFRVRRKCPLKSCVSVDTLSYFEYIEGHSNHIGSADMARTQHLLRLNEEAIKRLPLPE